MNVPLEQPSAGPVTLPAPPTHPIIVHAPSAEAPLTDVNLPVVVTDADGRIALSSTAFAELLGRRSEQLAGSAFSDLAVPEDRWLLARLMTRVRESEVDGRHAPLRDLLVRVQATDRVVPCLVGGAPIAPTDLAAGPSSATGLTIWVAARPGVVKGEPDPMHASVLAASLRGHPRS